MKSSVYISSNKIEVVGYEKAGKGVVIKDYVTCHLPEGTMINGKITDTDILAECLSALRDKKPDLLAEAVLVVDGSTVLLKRMVAPKLKNRQYRKLVTDEFADSAEGDVEWVCNYHLLESSGSESVAMLACAVEKTQVESYISTFRDADIKLKAVRVGVQAIVDYISSRVDLKETTFVLNVIDGVTMLSMIFENGVNIFMSRTRLYGENQEEFLQNIIENLSGMVQFNKSENFNDISYSYYLGLTGEDLAFMNVVDHHAEIKLEAFDIFSNSDEKANAGFAYLGTLLGDNSIDLIKSYRQLDRLEKLQSPQRRRIQLIAGGALIVVVLAVWLAAGIINVNNSISEITDYITSEEVVKRSAEIDKIIAKTAYYTNAAAQSEGKTEQEKSKIPVSNQALDLITQTNSNKVTVNVLDFDENTGVMRVNGTSSTETDSAEYIDKLKKNSLIKEIRYTGYSYNDDGKYNFSVDISLNAKDIPINAKETAQ